MNHHCRRRLKSNRATTTKQGKLRQRLRLTMEPLEQRDLLAVFTVTSPSDGVPNDLRSAVAAANLTPGTDTIRFRTNFVQLSLGEIAITDAVQLDGSTAPGGHVEIVASSLPNPARIFRVDDGSPVQQAVSMHELTLRGGDADEGGAILNSEDLQVSYSTITGNQARFGGGILNRFGRVVLDHVSVYDNTAEYQGGGVVNNEGILELRDSVVQANRASHPLGFSTVGGGIHNIGRAVNILENSQVLGNAAYAPATSLAQGGGISVMLESVLRMTDSDVGDNYASHEGGGIFVVDNSTATVELNSSVFGNIAGEAGGGMYLRGCNVDITDSTITGNVTELRGGGISAGQDVTLQMTQSRINDNTTEMFSNDGSGGGLYLSGFGAANGPVVTISGSTIHRNNYGPSGLPGGEFGGGISVRYGTSLSIDNTEISQNLASLSGGGIYASDRFSPFAPDITITGSRILGNRSGSWGGGLTAAGGMLNIAQTTIDANTADGHGGGMFLTGLGSPTLLQASLVDSNISGNFAGVNGGGASVGPGTTFTVDQSQVSDNGTYGRGGGLYLSELLSGAAPQVTHITGSQLLNNRATYDPNGPSDAFGGGVFAALGAELDVNATTVSGNHADNVGGGFVLAEDAVVTVQDSTISQNASGSHGGGFYVKNADVTLQQNTVYANRAAGNGGGLFVYSALQNRVQVAHNTISSNHGNVNSVLGQGGGIYVDNVPANNVQFDLEHTIVAGNRAGLILGSEFDIFDAGNHLAARFNLIGTNQGSGLAPGNPDLQGNLIGTSASPVDPLLDLAANGGPTMTILPMPGNPAMDAGDPSIPAPSGFDQRQSPFERLRHHRIDIGSVEMSPPLAPVDINFDGLANCDDVNMLVAQIASGVYQVTFDMNGDGVVDLSDLDRWLDDAPQYNGLNFQFYLPGDANLDGRVDGSDFANWNSNNFTATAAWCSGDFNADGFVDGVDFGIWNANKFMNSPPCPPCRPSVPNPEPVGPLDHTSATAPNLLLPAAVAPLPHMGKTAVADDDNRTDCIDVALRELVSQPVEQLVQLIQSIR